MTAPPLVGCVVWSYYSLLVIGSEKTINYSFIINTFSGLILNITHSTVKVSLNLNILAVFIVIILIPNIVSIFDRKNVIKILICQSEKESIIGMVSIRPFQ